MNKKGRQEEWKEDILNLPFVKEYLAKKIVAKNKEEEGFAELLNLVKDSQVEDLLNKIEELLSDKNKEIEQLKASLEVEAMNGHYLRKKLFNLELKGLDNEKRNI